MKKLTACMAVVAALAITAGATSEANAQAPPDPQMQRLEWLVGHWVHRGETPKGEALVVKRVCEWTLGGHYLTAQTQIEVAGEVVLKHRHMVRWDPNREQYHSWVFSSNGDFVQGQWKQIATRDWQGELAGQTLEGKRKVARSTYTWVDGNTYIYRLTDLRIAGRPPLPDIEWDFHRVQPGQ